MLGSLSISGDLTKLQVLKKPSEASVLATCYVCAVDNRYDSGQLLFDNVFKADGHDDDSGRRYVHPFQVPPADTHN